MDKTFVKGLTVLELLARSERPRGITSLANELGWTKSNVHRLLQTLTACGYSRQTENLTYDLTPKIWELGVLVRSKIGLAEVARDDMARLAADTGESVHLSVMDGFEVVYIDKIESLQPIGSYTRIGGRAPAWCVATGKAMLAHQNPAQAAVMPERQAFTPTTVTDEGAWVAEMKRAREQGYAVNRGEWRAEVFGIASPLRDGTGEIAGAIGISGPASRFGATQIKLWGETVVSAGASISRALGYREQGAAKREFVGSPKR